MPPSLVGLMPNELGPDPMLGALVVDEGASVRLTNCVRRSALRELTVSQAFQMGPALDSMCLSVPAMGQKSVRELHELLSRFAARSELPLSGEIDQQARSSTGQERSDLKQLLMTQVTRLFSAISLHDTIEAIGVSVRLAHCVGISPLRDVSLGELLVEWGQTSATLLGTKNFGRTSLLELKEACIGLIETHFGMNGLDHQSVATLRSLLFESAAAEGNEFNHLCRRLVALPEFHFSMLRSNDIQSPQALTAILFQELDERACDIVTRRYGLLGTVPETLEQIASSYDLTRERIRQLESKALGKMRLMKTRLPLQESLIGHGTAIWAAIAEDRDFLGLSDISNGLSICPHVRLLMDIQAISTSELLDQVATRWRGGWCRSDIDIGELDQARAELGLLLKGKELPRPLPPLHASGPFEIHRIAAVLGLGLRVHSGYVLCQENPARPQIRIIELHRLIGNRTNPSDAAELARQLGSARGGGTVSGRYVTAMMERYPHLFLEADDGQWFGIGGHDVVATDAELTPATAIEVNEESNDDGFTMTNLLRAILKEVGPTKLSRLVEIATERLPPERSPASIGPTLIMNAESFVRVLPGVYGLRDGVPSATDLLQQNPTYLLNDEQVRLYALGRRAGEPWGAFPLWSPAAEVAMCSWAPDHADPSVLQSLLSVATFDAWPVDASTRDAWKDFATKHPANFLLHFEPRSQVGYALPGIDRLLAACLEARASGQFNWMIGNRILKRPVYSHMSAGLLALMCSLGALSIEMGGHWQLPHSPGSKLEDRIALLAGELHDHGSLDWNSPLGTRLLSEAGETIGRWSGWLDMRLLATMLASSSTASGDGTIDFVGMAIEAEIGALDWATAEGASAPSRPHADQTLTDYSALEVRSARILSENEAEWSFEEDFFD